MKKRYSEEQIVKILHRGDRAAARTVLHVLKTD
jgi:hypothetical protein